MESLLLKLKNERGASLVEYALLIALVALIAIPAVTNLGQAIEGERCPPESYYTHNINKNGLGSVGAKLEHAGDQGHFGAPDGCNPGGTGNDL